jgi:nicotinate dehydrogenase subunit B
MSDAQVAELATFLRKQFAPDKPAWTDVQATVGRLRQSADSADRGFRRHPSF